MVVDTAAVSLVAFAMVLWATFTAVGGIFDRNEAGIEAFEATREEIYRNADTSVEVVDVDTQFTLLETRVDVTLSNTGRRSFAKADLAQWDVFLDYVPVTANDRRVSRLEYSDDLSDNTWTVRDIYLDHESQQDELINPSVVDPHEEIVIRTQVEPLIELGSEGRVVIHVPGEAQPLVAFFSN